jgi:hypothetical protein
MNSHRIRINTLALGTRLPTLLPFRGFVEAGGLMSYGPRFCRQLCNPVGNWQGCKSGLGALLFLELHGHVLQHRLPQLLLAADKRLRFGRGGRMHVGATCRKLVPDLRVH